MRKMVMSTGGLRTVVPTIVLGMILLAAVGVGNAHAQTYESLYPCLIDLPGWKAKDPEGMKMEMPGMKMINASRSYAKGKKEITVMIAIGNPAMAGYAAPQGMMNMETDEVKITVRTIRGFQVTAVNNKKDRSGAITVVLLPGQKGGAIFTLSFDGISEKEGLKLTEMFDWKVMQDKAKSF